MTDSERVGMIIATMTGGDMMIGEVEGGIMDMIGIGGGVVMMVGGEDLWMSETGVVQATGVGAGEDTDVIMLAMF